jgi:DNA-binding Lrp family transcriptional regulator
LPKESKSADRNSFDDRNPLLDAVNVALLSELHSNPRLPMSELARRVGMSAPAVTERVQRREKAGVINGYRMDVDPAALGMPVGAFVRIRPGPGQLPKIVKAARETNATGSPEKTASSSKCRRLRSPNSRKSSTVSSSTARQPRPSWCRRPCRDARCSLPLPADRHHDFNVCPFWTTSASLVTRPAGPAVPRRPS